MHMGLIRGGQSRANHVTSITTDSSRLSSSALVESEWIQDTRLWPVASSSPLKAHSQTTATRHPAIRSIRIASRSRSRFRTSFVSQKSVLVAGSRNSGQLSWWCQKHPCTKTATRHLLRTMSGLPGRPLSCSRNRSPECHSSLRTSTSGAVSLPRILDIRAERLSEVITSTICRDSSLVSTI